MTVLVALVASLVALPTPCPDDLLVDLGAPDQCLGAASDGGSPNQPAPSFCGCACHMGLDRGPEGLPPAALTSNDLRTGTRTDVPEPHHPPITHPPLT